MFCQAVLTYIKYFLTYRIHSYKSLSKFEKGPSKTFWVIFLRGSNVPISFIIMQSCFSFGQSLSKFNQLHSTPNHNAPVKSRKEPLSGYSVIVLTGSSVKKNSLCGIASILGWSFSKLTCSSPIQSLKKNGYWLAYQSAYSGGRPVLKPYNNDLMVDDTVTSSYNMVPKWSIWGAFTQKFQNPGPFFTWAVWNWDFCSSWAFLCVSFIPHNRNWDINAEEA